MEEREEKWKPGEEKWKEVSLCTSGLGNIRDLELKGSNNLKLRVEDTTTAYGLGRVNSQTTRATAARRSQVRLPAGGLTAWSLHVLPVHMWVLSSNGLATCPGCTPPPAHRLLEIGTSFPKIHYGRSDLENGKIQFQSK
ncbi:hypothetical protein ILYODFUR_005605 [Ilyodon furcidens]|uniref:Uncharacterized protein n=1 Tax=Ilyodon furcidens TaxID=33524 RepID=A0ABV0V480_9TELE